MHFSHNVALVGCGGVGGWLAQALSKTLKPDQKLILIDGDIITAKNLDRQLFSRDDIGKFKSDAIASRMVSKATVESLPHYFSESIDIGRDVIIFCAVDNHPARLAVLEYLDINGGMAFISANEYRDAEAYVYEPRWQGTKIDPRIYYPTIVTDHSGDPRSPCTGEEASGTRQLAIANMSSATYAMWLYWFWIEEAHKLSCKEAFPVHVSSNFSKIRTITRSEHELE